MDLVGGGTQNGNLIQIWDCNGWQSQQWSFSGSGPIKLLSDESKCVDIPGGDFSDGNYLWLWDCNGGPSQDFGYDDQAKTLYAASSVEDASACLDLPGGDKTNGNYLWLWSCSWP